MSIKFCSLATLERKTSFDIVNFISCEGDLDSDFAACAPLMCCVLGGWNAVTIEDYDGGPKVSRHIVTVEGAYLLICWVPMWPCYAMGQCPTVQHMLNLAVGPAMSGGKWFQIAFARTAFCGALGMSVSSKRADG